MNKLEVGMYVRIYDTAEDCILITKVEKILDDDYFLDTKKYQYGKFDIEKQSHNIIDLIEVGDYVNGQKVVAIHEHYVWNEEDIGTALETEHEYTAILNEDIKSIVTKEIYLSAEYRVESN